MTTSLLIVGGIALGLVAILLLRDVFLIVWKQGYERGRKDEGEMWVKCGERVEEFAREIHKGE